MRIIWFIGHESYRRSKGKNIPIGYIGEILVERGSESIPWALNIFRGNYFYV